MLKIIICLCFINLIQFSSNEKLIFASLHSRHGARAPLNCDDNHKDFLGEKWTNPGELTAIGHRMEYVLGLRNRQRYITGKYKKFLSDQYDPHEILVCSTNVNRTLLSMTSQLQGLYPSSSKAGNVLKPEQIDVSYPPANVSCEEIEIEVDNLNNSALPNFMTVIPIHTTTSSERKMNVQDSKGCKIVTLSLDSDIENTIIKPVINMVKNRKENDKRRYNVVNCLINDYRAKLFTKSTSCSTKIDTNNDILDIPKKVTQAFGRTTHEFYFKKDAINKMFANKNINNFGFNGPKQTYKVKRYKKVDVEN